MTTAYVIFCNDSLESVVLDDKHLAAAHLETLAYAHYCSARRAALNFKNYRKAVHWHIQDVKVFKP